MLSAPIGYKTQSIDTAIDAEMYLFGLWKTQTLVQKAEKLSSWTKGCLEMCLIGLRQRYPDVSSSKLRYEFARATLKSYFPDSIYRHISEYNQSLMLIDPISLALDVAAIMNRLEIPYLIGGSVASTLMGEMRATEDVDIVADLSIEKVIPLLKSLQPRFYVSEDAIRDAIRFKRSFNLIDNESLGKVDIFILKDNPFPQIEFQRRQSQIVRQNPDQMLVLPTPEDIILQKLVWYRMTKNESQRQWRDVLGVLKLQGDRLDFAYLQKWAVELSLSDLLETACTESGIEIFF
jgi:energy-coupling factor transporter ATP-binding protein EcfA2